MRQHPVHSSNNWRERSLGSGDDAFKKDEQPPQWNRWTGGPRKGGQKPAKDVGKVESDTNRIYVGNMVYHATPEDVMKHITDAGFEVKNLDMSMDPFTGRNPSYCFADLAGVEQARKAIETLNGTALLGRTLKVKPCVIKKPKRDQNQPIIDRWTRTDAEDHWRGVGDKKVRLFVGGLPKPVSQSEGEKWIQEIFSGYKIAAIGKVKSPPGSNKGSSENHYFTFVDFSAPEEAEAACKAINGEQFGAGKILVKLPRKDERGWINERDEALWLMGDDEEDTQRGVPLE